MKIDVHGGRVLLVVGGQATAHIEDDGDTTATLVAVGGSKLVFPGKNYSEPIGASFSNGAAIELADTDSAWLVEALKFLGFTLRKKKPFQPNEKRTRRRKSE